jgi:hypothetical protein
LADKTSPKKSGLPFGTCVRQNSTVFVQHDQQIWLEDYNNSIRGGPLVPRLVPMPFGDP